jgi:hypothetical protein
MPILIQCTSCGRKLRVQDHLLGKTVKCPNCQSKFQAQALEESTAPEPGAAGAPAPNGAEDAQKTPVVPPVDPSDMETPLVQIMELPQQPASKPPEARSKEPVLAVATPVSSPRTEPPTPAPPVLPPPFPTPPLKVFGVLGAIVLTAALVTLGCSWAVAAAVQRAVEARTAP